MVQAAARATARFVIGRSAIAVVAVLAMMATLTTVVLAADPAAGTLSDVSGPVTWTADFGPADSTLGGDCEASAAACDEFLLDLDLPVGYWDDHDGSVVITISWPTVADDFDLAVVPPGGDDGTSGQAATTSESVVLSEPTNGVRSVRTDPYQILSPTGVTVTGTAELVSTPTSTGGGGALDGEYFFDGVPTDQAGKVAGNPTATFATDTEPVGADLEVTQQASSLGNGDVPSNPALISWTGEFSGDLDTDIEIEWWWSALNPESVAIGSDVEVTFFADPTFSGGAEAGTIIGRAVVPIGIGTPAAPVRNLSRVHVEGSITSTLHIQAAPVFVDSGQGNVVHYNSAAHPSAFRQAPPVNQTPPGIDGLEGADPQGLAFSATVAADNQRDSSEPIVDSDLDGNIISCGPSGFSNAAEYASMSLDGGDQFHLLGEPPRGQIGSGGGGDCSWAFAPEKESPDANYPFAYTGLGPLTNFTASRSLDGRTIETTPISGETIPGVDRQWSVFLNQTDVLLSYNQQAPRQVVVQKATDGGLNYGVRVPATPTQPSFPGPMRALPAEFNPTGPENGRVAYFSWNQGTQIHFSVTFDGSESWSTCTIAVSPGEPSLFTTSDHDEDGNIYVAWTEDATYHTFISYLRIEDLAGCNEPVTENRSAPPTVNPGWSTPLQVDRGDVRTTVFAWLVASGEPGKVAVTYYGTETDGNPNEGAFKASWDVYVAQSLNMLDPDATFAQVRATTHPFHYDSICQEGLGCSISGGDRSLADFFAIDHDPVRDALVVVYDQGSKEPGDAAGQVATPAVVRQIAGPGMLDDAGPAIPDREPLRTGSVDPTGDALSGFSSLGAPLAVLPPDTVNQPGGDFTSVEVGPEVDLVTGEAVEDGGFTVTMTVDDLSTGAIDDAMSAMSAQSMLWLFRIVDGFQASAVGLTYDGAEFGAGYSEYATDDGECIGTGGKCIQYPLDQPVDFDVDQDTGVIRLNVPRAYLSALSPEPDATEGYPDRFTPAEVEVTVGSRIYDATAYSLGNTLSSTQDTQGYLYPLDNTPAFDFLIAEAGPEISVNDASLVEGDAGLANMAFTVTLSEAPATGETVEVTVDTAADTTGANPATADTDYATTTQTMVFAEGETTKTFDVPVAGDTDDEADETFLVELSNAVGGQIVDGTGVGTILDDDEPAPLPTLSIDDASAVEGDTGTTTMTFTVTLSDESADTVQVDYVTGNATATAGSDYVAASGTLTFDPGITTQEIDVTVTGDTDVEPDETFSVDLQNPTNATVAAGGGTGQGTILDDDTATGPTFSINDASEVEGDPGDANSVGFTVTLSEAPGAGETASVAWTTAGDTADEDVDYVGASDTLTFTEGETSKVIDIAITPDTEDEGDETFTVELSDPQGDSAPTIDRGTGTGTIIDDDDPLAPVEVSINDASVSEGDPGDDRHVEFTVTLSRESADTVTVDYGSADVTALAGEDYTATDGELTFLAGQTVKTVRVPVIEDLLDEDDETLTVTLSNASGADIDREVGTGTIIDDDARPQVSIDDVTQDEGDDGTAAFTFTVSIDAESGRDVSVDVDTTLLTATPGEDYTAVSTTVSIPAGSLSTTVDVDVNGDTDVEPNETFGVALSGAVNATLDKASGVGTITNDDVEATETETEPTGTETEPTETEPTGTETTGTETEPTETEPTGTETEPTETESDQDDDEVDRIGGDDRFDTSVLASQAQFPDDLSADAVVIARGDDPDGYADALAGTPFAFAENAPLLIVRPDALPDSIRDELRRVLAPGRTVYILGGPVAVDRTVEAQINALGFLTDRVFGGTRIDTAIAIAERLGNPDTLFVTTGYDFPDALTAGTAAAHVGGAVLLTRSEERVPETDAYLARFPSARVYAVGGPAARPYRNAVPVFGGTRHETATTVARTFFDSPDVIGVARSDAFPDALSGGPLLASLDAPMVLTPPTTLDTDAEDYICENSSSIRLAELFGGTRAISQTVSILVNSRIRGNNC